VCGWLRIVVFAFCLHVFVCVCILCPCSILLHINAILSAISDDILGGDIFVEHVHLVSDGSSLACHMRLNQHTTAFTVKVIKYSHAGYLVAYNPFCKQHMHLKLVCSINHRCELLVYQ
jgi:hypothetical protein